MARLPIISTTSRTRKALAVASLLLLAACGSEQSDTGLLFGAVRNIVTGPGPQPVTLQQAAAVPYASMGVRINGGSEILIVMVIDAPHSRLWTAGKAIAVQTDDGRIVRTSGFANNLSGVSGDLGAPVSPLDAVHHRDGKRTLLYDFADLNAYSVKTVCHAVSRGRETIQILGKAIPTIRIEETCRADALDWSFVNTYWAGAESGMVWQSVQHIHPSVGPITTEILRPPETH
jgi:hypothetical protein